jgi:hypothetical protein
MTEITLTDEYLASISYGLTHDVGFQWLASKSQLLSVIDELLSLRQQVKEQEQLFVDCKNALAHIDATERSRERLKIQVAKQSAQIDALVRAGDRIANSIDADTELSCDNSWMSGVDAWRKAVADVLHDSDKGE